MQCDRAMTCSPVCARRRSRGLQGDHVLARSVLKSSLCRWLRRRFPCFRSSCRETDRCYLALLVSWRWSFLAVSERKAPKSLTVCWDIVKGSGVSKDGENEL